MGKLLVLVTLFWFLIVLTQQERKNDRCKTQRYSPPPPMSLLFLTYET
jgi:hypothetical protein